MTDTTPADTTPSTSDLERRRAVVDMLRHSLEAGEDIRLAVSGQCMEPLIVDGDEVAVAPPPADRDPAVGALWLAHSPTFELVCHRIIDRRDDTLLLGGDRTLHLDIHPPGSLLGPVIAVHRGDRAFSIRTGPLERLQSRLHLATWRRRRHPRYLLLWHWPRRLLMELRALGWKRS